jgi:hypothetical protein
MCLSTRFHLSGFRVYQDLPVGSARILLTRSLVANSLYRGEPHDAQEQEAQIGSAELRRQNKLRIRAVLSTAVGLIAAGAA